MEHRSSSSQQAGVEQTSVVVFADRLEMSSAWLSADADVLPDYTIIDCLGCNHCLLSSFPYMWKSITACPLSVSAPFIAIINQDCRLRPFLAITSFVLLMSPFALSRLLASALHYSKLPHSKEYFLPIPAPPSFCSLNITIPTMSPPTPPTPPTFQIRSHRQNGRVHRRKRQKIQLLRLCRAAPGFLPNCR